jgi:hypothetical protein
VIGATLPVSQHPLISGAECTVIASEVRRLHSNWTHRSKGAFYSLGAASYLDAVTDRAQYLSAAQATNKLLLESFGALYERVMTFLRELMDEEVSLDLERAVPGFHVFVEGSGDNSVDNPARRAHFDLQWQYAYPRAKPDGTLSFTMAIAVPSGGASMAWWPLRYDRRNPFGGDTWSRTLAQAPQVVPYAPGRLVLHDGMVLHAVGAHQTAPPAGLRITLQGHGVKLGGRWRLYW